MVHIEKMNAYNSFYVWFDYESEMSPLYKFRNCVRLSHTKKIIGNELSYTKGQEVTNIFYNVTTISKNLPIRSCCK